MTADPHASSNGPTGSTHGLSNPQSGGQPETPPHVRGLLSHIDAGETLAEDDAHALFSALLSGQLAQAQIEHLLTTLHQRRPTVDEIVGAARVMRANVTPIPLSDAEREHVIDTCGTGGAPKAFNVSTAAAIVAASAARAAGKPLLVAKHGNRSRTGRGSAEILAALGVNVDATPEVQSRCLRDVGVCFCFAIHHHPAMRFAGPARRALPHPTIFNALGPMTNPAAARRQLIGVYDPRLGPEIAAALARLGARRAMVAHSADGLDELSVTAAAELSLVRDGGVSHEMLDATTLGLPRRTLADIQARDLDDAAAIFRAVLDPACASNARLDACRDMVALNAAAALMVADAADSWPTALALCQAALRSGAASRTLAALAECSRKT
ncbi:MAG: anthranilate phosphoribosyltransferase [Planctomycetota bacterium]|nr:anthranilate phosphoribosyltransferase [Planctomycetota bacterium]